MRVVGSLPGSVLLVFYVARYAFFYVESKQSVCGDRSLTRVPESCEGAAWEPALWLQCGGRSDPVLGGVTRLLSRGDV